MLRFADEAHPHHVDLPVDVATEKVAVVGVSGSGKTTLAAVLVEEVHEAGGRVVVLDTQGEWWSLRAGRDGQEGLPFVIFGGEKADVPIDAGMGKKLGTVLVESSVSAVVDASRIPARARGAFFTALLTELYEGNRRPLFLVVDEADLFAPQKPSRAGAQELLDVMVDVVRRGRKFGFGAMLITQRPAAVAKEVLSQAETLFVTRLAGEHDQGAIDRWLGTHVPRTEREAVLATLATLPTGEVWGVSPHWPGKVTRARVRPRRTLDASKTPQLGVAAGPPPKLTPVHLAELAKLLAPEPEGVDAGNFAAHQRRAQPEVAEAELQRLREELAAERAKPPREVPVLSPEHVSLLQDLRDRIDATLHRFGAPAARQAIPPPAAAPKVPRPNRAAKWIPGDRVREGEVFGPAPAAGQPKGGKGRMLAALRRMARPLSRDELATLAHVARNGGTFTNYLSELKTEGLIHVRADRTIEATEAGLAAFHLGPTVPFRLSEVIAAWAFGRAQGAMVAALVAAADRGCTREELAKAGGIEVSGGTFGNYLSEIRVAGFLSERNRRVFLAPFLLGLAR